MLRNNEPGQSQTSRLSDVPVGIARLMTYWLFLFWLLLGFGINAMETIVYLSDSETYHRVYRDPLLYFATILGFAFLHVAAIALHLAGWRTLRFSPSAIAISILFIAFSVVLWSGGLFVTCCG